MRPHVSATLSTVTETTAYQLDPSKNPFAVSIGVVATSTISYTVQHTFDPWGSITTWFDHETLAAQTASADGNYAFPVTAVRLKVNSVTGGTAIMTVIQAG